MNMKGKIAVVTGGASGIGLATVQGLAEAGATVFLGDIAVDKGEEAAAAERAAGRDVQFVKLDVTSDESIAAFAAAALARDNRVDVVINAAGWGKIQPFLENPPEFWDRVIDLNFVGPMKVCKAFFPNMMERKSGKIVNVASDAGRVGSTGETVYSGAKGGIIAFSKGLAREAARYSVNVNVVCPGPTDTPLLMAVPEKHREAFQRAIPFRRFGKPSEVADAIIFFASPRSDYITGQVLSVNGGLVMT